MQKNNKIPPFSHPSKTIFKASPSTSLYMAQPTFPPTPCTTFNLRPTISMAFIFVSAALTLSLLLTPASAQQNPGSYDIRAEKGWDNFVKDAAKGTGGTPINMNEFATRVNNNINDGGDEAADPELIDELKNFDGSRSSTSVKTESGKSKPPEPSSEPTAAMDSLATAKMIASANGGTLALANAPTNGAFSMEVAGLVSGILPVIAACFVL